jgi:hypothetical protein
VRCRGPGQSPGGEPKAGRSPTLRKNYFRYRGLDIVAKNAALVIECFSA